MVMDVRTGPADAGEAGQEAASCPATEQASSWRAAPEEILVVIPALNEADHIEACLRSLWTGDARLAHCLFVVADGGSTDSTREIVLGLASEAGNLRLIDNPAQLQSAGINEAVRRLGQARNILVRCDAHSIYPPGYVTRVADSLLRHGADSLVTPMDAVGQTCFQKANAWVVDTPLGSGGSAHRGGTCSAWVDHGHHAGFDLDAYRALGGYDDGFSHNEDGEYDQRLVRTGRHIYLDASIRLTYHPRATLGGLARQYYNYGRGRARTILKHRAQPRLRQIAPVLNLVALFAAISLAFVHPLPLIYPVAYFGTLGAASVWLAWRHRSACGLLCGLAALVMHIAWGMGFLRQVFAGATGRRVSRPGVPE